MKKNINMAQEYLDAEKPIPDTLTGKMDLEELSIIVRMQHFKNDIEKALNKEIDETPIHFDAPQNTNEQPVTGHSFPYRHYFLIPAAALLGIAIGLSMMHSLTTRNLVREDVKSFVTTLTTSNTWWEKSIENEGFPSGWFDAEPVVENY